MNETAVSDEAQVIQDQVDAFNARDVERFVSFYHPDAVLEDATGNVMMQGHDQLRAFYGAMFAQSPDLHADIVTRIRVGAWIIDEEDGRGFNVEGFPPMLHCAVIYQVVDGKIARARMLI
jgi:hypothetical protein